jgi:hypothetical protein
VCHSVTVVDGVHAVPLEVPVPMHATSLFQWPVAFNPLTFNVSYSNLGRLWHHAINVLNTTSGSTVLECRYSLL